MAVVDLYCLACAPLQSSRLEKPKQSDLTLEELQKELALLLKLTSCGFQDFISFFEKTAKEQALSERAAALCCFAAFCTRLQALIQAAGSTAWDLHRHYNTNKKSAALLKDIETIARSEGLIPSDQNLAELFDTEEDAEWQSVSIGHGRVEFRQAVSFVQPHDVTADSADSPELSSGSFVRNRRRKPTGYPKSKISETKSREDSEEGNADTTSIMKAKGGSAPEKKTEFSSWCGSLCETCRRVEPDTQGELTSESLKATATADRMGRSSSVSIAAIQEINDEAGDQRWSETSRRISRTERIRKRLPTGHPLQMRDSSDNVLNALAGES